MIYMQMNGKIFDAPSLRERVIYMQCCYTTNIVSNQNGLTYCVHFKEGLLYQSNHVKSVQFERLQKDVQFETGAKI